MPLLFDLLANVCSLHYNATSHRTSGWKAKGAGEVQVDKISDQIIIFKESGMSEVAEGNPLRFSNTYRWTLLAGDCIKLEHLRQGIENPVYLFDLQQLSDVLWKSKAPHLCGSDLYSADLEIIDGHTIKLDWKVQGDEKDESLVCFYNARG